MPTELEMPIVRRGTPADAEALAAFAARVFQETFATDTSPEDMARFLANTYSRTHQAAELSAPDVTTLLALVDDTLAGFAQVRPGEPLDVLTSSSPVELWRLYVDRRWHGRGVAQALMTMVEADARERGADSLWLGVWEHNARAQAFYRKFGFTTVGSHVFLLGDDAQTDVIMVRTL